MQKQVTSEMPSTKNMSAVDQMKLKMSNFELDNRIMKIVSGKLMDLNDNVQKIKTDTKENQMSFARISDKMSDINAKLDREAAQKGEMKTLKDRMLQQEKDLMKSIKDAEELVQKNDIKCDTMSAKILRMDEERKVFIAVKDVFKAELKDYEGLLEEFKSIQEKNHFELKIEMSRKFQDFDNKLMELNVDKNQTKAMLRNQNFHFTEMQKAIAIAEEKVREINERTAPLEPAIRQLNETDRYIRFYLPFFNFKMIFECLKDVLKTSPTPMRRDLHIHCQKKTEQIQERMKVMGTPEEGEFPKDSLGNLNWLNIQTVTQELKWECEEEAEERKKKAEEEMQAKLSRKPSEYVFRDRLFDPEIIKRLTGYISDNMNAKMSGIVTDTVKNIPEIKQLLEFYALEYQDDGEEDEEESSEDYGEEGGEDELSEMKDLQNMIKDKLSKSLQSKVKQTKKKTKVSAKESMNSSSSSSGSSQDSSSSSSSSESASSALNSSSIPTTLTSVQKLKKQKKEKPEKTEKPAKKKKVKKISSSSSSGRSSSEKPRSRESSDSIDKLGKLKSISNYTDNDSASRNSSHERSVNRLGEEGVKRQIRKAKESSSGESIISGKSDDTTNIQKNNKKRKALNDKYRDKLDKATAPEGLIEKIEKGEKPDQIEVEKIEAKRKTTRKAEQIEIRQRRKKSSKQKKKVNDDEAEDELYPKRRRAKKRPAGPPTEQILDKSQNSESQRSQIMMKQITRIVKKQQSFKKDLKKIGKASQERSLHILDIDMEIENSIEEEAVDAMSPSTLPSKDNSALQRISGMGSNNTGRTSKVVDKSSRIVSPTPDGGQKKASKQKIRATSNDRTPQSSSLRPTSINTKKQERDSKLGQNLKDAPISPRKAGKKGVRKQSARGQRNTDEPQTPFTATAKGQSVTSKMHSRKPNMAQNQTGGVLKQVLEKVNDELAHYAPLQPYNETRADLGRALGMIQILKKEMQIYKEFFQTSINSKEIQKQTNMINQQIDIAAGVVKQSKNSHLAPRSSNSIGNDSPISTIGSPNSDHHLNEPIRPILVAVQGTLNTLFGKVMKIEQNYARDKVQKLPQDIERIATDEVLMRQQIGDVLEQQSNVKEKLDGDLKMLRREHLVNLKQIDNIERLFKDNNDKLTNMVERQHMNDLAMATMLKVMKIDYSLEEQDERDRKETFLMGADYTDAPANVAQTKPSVTIGEHSINFADESILSRSPQSNRKSRYGDEYKMKERASTRLPLEAVMRQKRDGVPPIVSLDKNCLTCEQSGHNELVMKAFKIACLKYEPSGVAFENAQYHRDQLLDAKYGLIQFCLTQLKHLDLGNIYQKKYAQQLEQSLSQSSTGKRTAPTDGHQAPNNEYSTIDPRDLPSFPESARNHNYPTSNWETLAQNLDSRSQFQTIGGKTQNAFSPNGMAPVLQQVPQTANHLSNTRYSAYTTVKRNIGTSAAQGTRAKILLANSVGSADKIKRLQVDGDQAQLLQKQPRRRTNAGLSIPQGLMDFNSMAPLQSYEAPMTGGWAGNNLYSPTQAQLDQIYQQQMMNYQSGMSSGQQPMLSMNQGVPMQPQNYMQQTNQGANQRHKVHLPSLRQEMGVQSTAKKDQKTMSRATKGSRQPINSQIKVATNKDILSQKQQVQMDENSHPPRTGATGSQLTSQISQKKMGNLNEAFMNSDHSQSNHSSKNITECALDVDQNDLDRTPAPMPHQTELDESIDESQAIPSSQKLI